MVLHSVLDVDARLDLGFARDYADAVQGWRRSDDPEWVLRACRVLRHLGDDRGGEALSLRAGRRWSTHPGLQVAMLRTVLGNRGAYAYWTVSERHPLPADANDVDRAERLSLQGFWLAHLRDGPRALADQREALRLQPQDAWLWVEHSYALGLLDRREQALEAIEQGLRVNPRHRAALQQRAQLWWQAGRREEARAILEATWEQGEHGSLAAQLYSMADEEARYADALRWLDEMERAFPLADRNRRRMLPSCRADSLLALGRVAEAREQAAQVPGEGFYKQLAQRLAEPGAKAQRVLLALEQVYQHWNTCAPATLTALARFWGRSVDHLELAQAICYDGTPYVAQRRWAESQGFVVREFKPDWESSCALIDAGLPFALGTQSVGSGHLQAVVGYDRLRRTLLIRDPSLWRHSEYLADPLFDEQWAHNDRALLLLPPEAQSRLQGLVLPQVADWDLGYPLELALDRHDRPAAVQALLTLAEAVPQSLRLLRARRSLAIYDGDEAQVLAATEAVLAHCPQDVNLRLSKVTSLFAVRGAEAGEAELRELVQARYPDVLVLVRWAARLALDARRLPEAFFHIRRALRRNGCSGRAWSELGDRIWQAQDAAAALDPERWASTLMPTEEWAARTYARACRVAGQAELGLSWLRERVAEWGDRSTAPAMSLAEELDAQQRAPEAEAVLQDALRRRPSDAALLLELAERRLRRQQLDEAAALLARCPDAHAAALLRVRAQCLEMQGEVPAAQAAVREALAVAPLDLGLHRLLLRLLRRDVGTAEALRQWRPLADARPAHVGLQRLLYDALPDQPEVINAQLDRLHAHHPLDDWLQRERAVQAARQGRLDEAVALAEAALALAPGQSVSHNVLGYCINRRDGHAAAVPHWREALRLDAEFDAPADNLFAAADAPSLRAATDYLAGELRRQSLLGDGLLNFQALAPRGWSDDEVFHTLQELVARWPSLWQSAVALARQQIRMGRRDDALAALRSAAERFPALPRVHLELAEALQAAGAIDEALESNARALALSPSWNRAVRLQVDLLCDHGVRWAEALAVLDRALGDRLGFEDADLIGLRAWVCQRQGDEAMAWSEARRSLLLDPGATWIWTLARGVAERAEDLARVDALLEEVVRSRPGDASAWLVQATQLRDDEHALAAAERAIALDPLRQRAWQERFERLNRLGRQDELLSALEALSWPGGVPVALRAWRARVRRHRGETQAALVEMRSLCDHAVSETELWVQCADWYDEADDHTGYLEAAQHLQQLEPQSPRSHCYLGHALLKGGQAAEALPWLQRAAELQPNYPFAVHALVDAARASKQPLAADAALDALWRLAPTARVAARGIEAAAKGGDRARSFAWLNRLFELKGYELQTCEQALAAMREASWGDALNDVLRAQVSAGGGPVGVVLCWLRERDRWHGALYTLWQADSWLRKTPHLPLLKGLLRWLVGRESHFLLRRLVIRYAGALRADEEAWGEVSYALLQNDAYRATCDWTVDWAGRDRAPVWALGNRCGALAMCGRWSEVAAVVDAALDRAPYNEDLRFWQLATLVWRREHTGLLSAWQHRHEWEAEAWMKPALESLQAFLDAAQSGFTDSAPLRRLRANRGATRGKGFGQALQSLLEREALQQRSDVPAWLKRPLAWLA